MKTIRIPDYAGAAEQVAEMVKHLTSEGLTFEVILTRGPWEWVIEITGEKN
jgi:hypothetical protein